LGEAGAPSGALKTLFAAHAGAKTARPVSARVGSVKNNDASFIEPIV
jgi:hypothetical protein